MKYLLSLSVLLCTLILFSCGKDDDDSSTAELTGKIRGVDYTFGSARFGPAGNDQIFIRADNAGPEIMDSCDTNSDDVYFRIDADLNTDRQELFWNFSTGEGITMTFHHPDFFQNKIIDDGGYYQITEIAVDAIKITIDVQFDDDNFLKGSFTAIDCN